MKAKYLEDFKITVKPLKLENENADIWALGITVLEVYLSLYVM